MTDTAHSNRDGEPRGGETVASAMSADVTRVSSRGGAAVCPACGAPARRPEARFCATCGRNLARPEYFPTDALRASYHDQRNGLPFGQFDQHHHGATRGNAPRRRWTHAPDARDSRMNRDGEPRPVGNDYRRTATRGSGKQYRPWPRGRAPESPGACMNKSNGAAATATALVTYALVPYFGILFCFGAVLLGGVGLSRARRAPHLGGGRASLLSILFGFVILCAQIFLWWILYKVPEWTRQF